MSVVDRLPRELRTVVEVLRQTLDAWTTDHIPLRAAAISYYFLITLAPLTLVALYLWSHIIGGIDPASFGDAAGMAADGDIGSQIVGISQSYANQVGASGPLIALGVALFGATVLLAQFTAALDVIWKTAPEGRRGWRYTLRTRLLAIAALFVTMLSLIALGVFAALLSTGLQFLRDLLDLSLELPAYLSTLLDLSWVLALVLVAFLLSFAFTWLPRRSIRWLDTVPGAVITAGAYLVGQQVLSIYLRQSAVVSAFGATGTLVALILWIYYTMQVVLFGAELTKVMVLRAEKRRDDRRSAGDSVGESDTSNDPELAPES